MLFTNVRGNEFNIFRLGASTEDQHHDYLYSAWRSRRLPCIFRCMWKFVANLANYNTAHVLSVAN
jgi:hypothetical protein